MTTRQGTAGRLGAGSSRAAASPAGGTAGRWAHARRPRRGPRLGPAWRAVALLLAAAAGIVTAVALAPSGASAGAASGGVISCHHGTTTVARTMPVHTRGALLLGVGPNFSTPHNPFAGTCVLSGTIPAGWSVEVTGFSALSATAGSGNAGSLEYYDIGNTTFLDPGAFTNSGTFVDITTGFSQQLAVADFVNTGMVVAEGPGLSFAAAPGSQPAVPAARFLDQGTVRVDRAGVFAVGGAAHTTFVLAPGGTIAATGTFNIANYSTFAMEGGTVTAGMLHTSQFLGQAPPTFTFGEHLPAASTGTISDTNGGMLTGVIPRHWRVDVTGGSLTATPGSGNAGTLEYATDNSTLLDPGTFTNAGLLVDNSTGWVQQLAVANFINTGTVVANGPGLTFAAAPSSQPAVPVARFLDQGSVRVAHGGVFSSGGAAHTTFVLPRGGTITATGTFNIANYSTFAIEGGAVSTGVLQTSQFLGALAPTFQFAAHVPPASTGAISDTNGGTLQGVIPRHWRFALTGGSLTAMPGAGNAGALTVFTGGTFLAPSTFANGGTLFDGHAVEAADLINQVYATLVVTTGGRLAASGSVSNAGHLALAVGAVATVGGAFAQEPTGRLAVSVAGTIPGATYSHLVVKGTARLGGVLSIARGAGYVAKVGDSQQIVTAAAIAAPFRAVLGAAAGPGLAFKVAYSPTAVTLTVGH